MVNGPNTAALAPVDEHGRVVQKMFGRIAPGYDRANRIMSLGIDERWRARAVAGLLSHLPSGAAGSILDLCAGTLDSTLAIHRAWPRAQILAGDFVEAMLTAGHDKLVGDAAAKIETRVMDAHSLPVPSASMDAIFCAFGIRNVSELERATAEQARVLRPGGRLCVLEFFRPTGIVSRVVHGVYNRAVLPLVGWAVTGDLEAYRYLPRSIGRFCTTSQYADMLRAHGFVDVECERLTLGMAWIIRARAGAGAGQ